MSDRIDGYAQALVSVARAEGNLEATRAELADVARAVDGSDELRAALSNNLLPAAVRSQIVDDILKNKASDTTRALVGMIVSAGRGGELSSIVDSFVRQVASGDGRQVATVRSASPLSAEQQLRLAKALSTRAGTDIELDVIIDPTLVGGVVTALGDTVIDGSLRTRLGQLNESF